MNVWVRYHQLNRLRFHNTDVVLSRVGISLIKSDRIEYATVDRRQLRGFRASELRGAYDRH